MADYENGEVQDLDLSDDKVVTKYKAAAEICNSACIVGACLLQQCGTLCVGCAAHTATIAAINWLARAMQETQPGA